MHLGILFLFCLFVILYHTHPAFTSLMVFQPLFYTLVMPALLLPIRHSLPHLCLPTSLSCIYTLSTNSLLQLSLPFCFWLWIASCGHGFYFSFCNNLPFSNNLSPSFFSNFQHHIFSLSLFSYFLFMHSLYLFLPHLASNLLTLLGSTQQLHGGVWRTFSEPKLSSRKEKKLLKYNPGANVTNKF